MPRVLCDLPYRLLNCRPQWSAITLPVGKRVRRRRVERSIWYLMVDQPVKKKDSEQSESQVSEDGRPSAFYGAPRPVVCSWLVDPDKARSTQSPTGNL